MASYYYLISSLPMLKSDGTIPFSYQTFLDMCKTAVSPSVYSALETLDVISGKGPLLTEWSAYYGTLTRELNYQRNLRLGKEPKSSELHDSAAAATAAAALNAKNPLEAEKLLLAHQFRQLDSLVNMHYFDDYVLFGYAVKLKLLERLHCFHHKEGSEEFQSLFNGVQQKILSLS